MDGGLRAAVLFSPPLHLRMDDFLSNRWGPPQSAACFWVTVTIHSVSFGEVPDVFPRTRFVFEPAQKVRSHHLVEQNERTGDLPRFSLPNVTETLRLL